METIPLSPKFQRQAYLHQLEETTKIESWGQRNEALMWYTAIQIRTLNKRHEQSGDYYNWYYTLFSYPTIGLSTLSGVLGFNTTVFPKYTHYITSSISIITALLVAYTKFMRLGELVESHYRTARMYNMLYYKVVRELCLDKSERSYAPDFIQQVHQESGDLYKISPRVPERIKNRRLSHDQWKTDVYRSILEKEEEPGSLKDILLDNVLRLGECPVDEKGDENA